MPRYDGLEDVCKRSLPSYFSNPKSPASVLTRELYTFGDITLTDNILGVPISYDVNSFFQVNLEAYHLALQDIKKAATGMGVTDMYSGVGSIGLTVSEKPPRLIEIDQHSVTQARLNAGEGAEVIHAASENATEYLPCDETEVVIFDPPRAGLHAKVTEATLAILPKKLVYLSCNPSTFARDLQLLEESYDITSLTGLAFSHGLPILKHWLFWVPRP